jgi:hypothetical protein
MVSPSVCQTTTTASVMALSMPFVTHCDKNHRRLGSDQMEPTLRVGSKVYIGPNVIDYEICEINNDYVLIHSKNTGYVQMSFTEVENLFGV